MSTVCFYPDCGNVFRISQVDGISYFIMDKYEHSTSIVENRCKNQVYYNGITSRSIIKRETLCNIGNEIIEALGTYKHYMIDNSIKNRKYQVWTNTQLTIGGQGGQENYLLSTDGKHNAISLSRILDTSKGEKSPSGASQCTFSSNNKEECESFVSWLNTKFTRFFVAINISKLTGILTDDYFRFVPAPTVLDSNGNRVPGKFDHVYTDQELYKTFNLPQKYIDVIESVIKERK
jgi:hypothetical protein